MNHRHLAALAFFLFPVFSHAEDGKELVKDAAAAKPTIVQPPMTPEQMKAAGERATKAAEKMGWHIGCQAWTFNKRSFFQAVDVVNSLGLHYIEGFPNQVVDTDKSIKMGPSLSPEAREAIKKKLADSDVKLTSFGVASIPTDEAGTRAMFDFARDMGIATIVCEPVKEQMGALDKLANEYHIKIAIHNHPAPAARYWNPDVELDALEGHSEMCGSCADVGHWQRSGIKPVDALEKLKGRIIESHFKDLNQFGNVAAYDVPWGTGTGDPKAILEEFKKQGAKPTILVEYEHFTPGLVQDVAHSIDWFATTVEQMSP